MVIPVTIWMNMPSFYQEDLFRALNATGEVDLRVTYAHPLPQDRQALGWEASFSDYDYRFLSDSASSGPIAFAQALRLAQQERNRFHIVNGIWAEPSFAAGLMAMYVSGTRYAIYSEAQNPYRRRSQLKSKSTQMFGHQIVKQASGILPVAQFGVDYYRALGATDSQIYPFGYFRQVEPLQLVQEDSDVASDTIEYVYIGQLVHRKGIDLLIRALSEVMHSSTQKCNLTLIGDGPERDAYVELTRDLGVESAVSFLGARPSNEIPMYIRGADALILPSRWDGWGLVVNEALMSGVPAIVSDACGASTLIRNGETGYIFTSEDVDALAGCIQAISVAKEQNYDFSPALTTLGSRISPNSAADYLVDCIAHMCQRNDAVKPIPPWWDQ